MHGWHSGYCVRLQSEFSRVRVPPRAFKMKKRVYLIHGWGGTSEGGWFDWLKIKLKEKGFEVLGINMPNTDEPKIEEWVGYLKERIPEIGEEDYFVGHSIGCQTILRFLEKSHKHQRVKGCAFVAGWFNLKGLSEGEMNIAHPWINNPIDFGRVLDHCNNFLAVFSKDDPLVDLGESEKFRNSLNAKIIIKEKEVHFNESSEIQEVLDFIK
jgi:uncharacterized protein